MKKNIFKIIVSFYIKLFPGKLVVLAFLSMASANNSFEVKACQNSFPEQPKKVYIDCTKVIFGFDYDSPLKQITYGVNNILRFNFGALKAAKRLSGNKEDRDKIFAFLYSCRSECHENNEHADYCRAKMQGYYIPEIIKELILNENYTIDDFIKEVYQKIDSSDLYYKTKEDKRIAKEFVNLVANPPYKNFVFLEKKGMDFVRRLKEEGFMVSLLFNVSKEFFDQFKSQYPAAIKEFDEVIFPEDLPMPCGLKPEKSFFEGFIKEHGKDGIFVDDEKENIEAAKKFGLKKRFYFDLCSPDNFTKFMKQFN